MTRIATLAAALTILVAPASATNPDGHGCGGPGLVSPFDCPGGQGASWEATDSYYGDNIAGLDVVRLHLDASGFAFSGMTGIRFEGAYPSNLVECIDGGPGVGVLASNPGYSVGWQCVDDGQGAGGYVIDLGRDEVDPPPPTLLQGAELWLDFQVLAGAPDGKVELHTDLVRWKRWPTVDPPIQVEEAAILYVPEAATPWALAAGCPWLVFLARRRRRAHR